MHERLGARRLLKAAVDLARPGGFGDVCPGSTGRFFDLNYAAC